MTVVVMVVGMMLVAGVWREVVMIVVMVMTEMIEGKRKIINNTEEM